MRASVWHGDCLVRAMFRDATLSILYAVLVVLTAHVVVLVAGATPVDADVMALMAP
jgi:hypothetical protein